MILDDAEVGVAALLVNSGDCYIHVRGEGQTSLPRQPLTANGKLYLRGDDSLVCFAIGAPG